MKRALVLFAAVLAGALVGARVQAQVPPDPTFTLDALTVQAGGTLIATGDCGALTTNVEPTISVFRPIDQEPPIPYDLSFQGSVEPDGSFEIGIVIPADAPAGQFRADVSCTFDGDQVIRGNSVDFEVTPGPVQPTTTLPPLSATTAASPPAQPGAAPPAPAQPPAAVPVAASPAYTG